MQHAVKQNFEQPCAMARRRGGVCVSNAAVAPELCISNLPWAGGKAQH